MASSNHCGRASGLSITCSKKRAALALLDWFHVEHWATEPLRRCVVVAVALLQRTLLWLPLLWTIPGPAQLQPRQPAVRAYLLAVARHWLPPGVGWLAADVPMRYPDDILAEFRAVVRAERRTLIVGRAQRDAAPGCRAGCFDGTMNYPLGLGRSSAGSAPGRCRSAAAAGPCPEPPTSPWIRPAPRRFERGAGLYGPAINRWPASTCLDSHDTPRALHVLPPATGGPGPGPAAPVPAARCALPLLRHRDGLAVH